MKLLSVLLKLYLECVTKQKSDKKKFSEVQPFQWSLVEKHYPGQYDLEMTCPFMTFSK